jgi:UDP-3-O-[3-hydroxymyristoyl] glucosamine N-acyltransferase
MHLQDILSYDSSLTLVHGDQGGKYLQISLPDELKSHSVVFVKNQKFLSSLLKSLEHEFSDIACVFDQKLWSSLNEDQLQVLKSKARVVARTSNVPLSIARLSEPFYQARMGELQQSVDGRQMGTSDIEASALISQGVFIGEHVTIGAHVVIHPGVVIQSHVSIGEHSVLYPNVTVMPFTKIGKHVRIHANTTIGSDGFGYVFDKGVHHKIWHMGGVEIQDRVEIGSNCSIDMGAFTATVIGAGSKIDNQVQIAHNVKIGKGCILCGQAGVAGSAVLEDYVVLGGRAAIGPDAHIGQATQVAGGAMVNEGARWPQGSILGGHPARDIKEWMKTFAWVRKNALKS